MMNEPAPDDPTLKDAVDSWASEDDNTDRLIELVSEFGEYDRTPLSRHELAVESVDTNPGACEVFVPPEFPETLFPVLESFVEEYSPMPKACFANAAELARFDDRFDVVEGVTASEETGNVHDHAWNYFDGVAVDVTRPSAERYGVRIPNSVVRDVLPVLENENQWNILTNNAVPSNNMPPYS